MLSLIAGCYNSDAFDKLSAHDSSSSTSSNPETATSVVSVTVSASGTGASTSGSGVDSSTAEGGDPEDEPTSGTTSGSVGPTVSLTVDPPILQLAGPVEFTVEHSADAVRFELWDAIDNEHFQSEWLKGQKPPPYVITKGAPGETRSLTVRAYDSEGNVGVSTPATVELQLPASGTTLWETEVALDDVSQARAITSGMYTNSVAVFPGYDAGHAARVSRVNAQGKVNVNAPVAEPLSTTTGVALTPDGFILAAGVDLLENNKNAGWVARVNPTDAGVERIWTGKIGESYTGLAYDPEAERIYLSGYAPKGSEAPDARLWALSADGADLLWTMAWQRPFDDQDNLEDPSDRGLAVAVLENGDVALVGETWHLPDEKKKPDRWAFVLRYTAGGLLAEDMVWTSAASVEYAGALAVSADVDNGILVAGWSSPLEGGHQATIWAFNELLQPAELYSQGLANTTSKAVARLTTGEIVTVVDVDTDERHDFEVRALESGFTSAWARVFSGGSETRGAAVTITPHGHIVVAGTRVEANTSTMLLIGLHS
ncbi:MAG: hypothetical protein R3F14_37545 [Polyangiaceae bacterium]